jgi:hypothetical protein
MTKIIDEVTVNGHPWYGWTLEVKTGDDWIAEADSLLPREVAQIRLRYQNSAHAEDTHYRFVPTQE